uniref:Uncharacterized protein n=1 Tax=viral metagenome TaxID=1070528 RepID=A0A6H1ZNK2_9ZZZZ
MIEQPHVKPMSFEQAVNYLNKKRKDAKQDAKKNAEKAQISLALEPDRRKYLLYTLSCLDTVSFEVEKVFLQITKSVSSSISRKDIALMLRQILLLRVYNYSIKQIADKLKESPVVIVRCEQLGMIAVQEAIQRHKINGIPLVGG